MRKNWFSSRHHESAYLHALGYASIVTAYSTVPDLGYPVVLCAASAVVVFVCWILSN